MRTYIKAKKLKMGQVFRDERVIPVTLIELETIPEGELKEGDKLMVSGISKGKGFQGVVKRHGFHGGPKTHGQKNRFRAGGSIGSTAPQRVTPGRRMAGHMGTERITVKNLKVVGVDKENNLLFIKGAVPGARSGLLEVRKIPARHSPEAKPMAGGESKK